MANVITEKDIQHFKKLYVNCFGITLTDKDAISKLTSLLEMLKVVTKGVGK